MTEIEMKAEIEAALRNVQSSYARLYSSIELLNANLQQQKIFDSAVSDGPKWVDLKRACTLKGVNYDTVKSQWYKQPKAGDPDKVLNGRKYWSKESISMWLEVGDEDLANYLMTFDKKLSSEVSKQISKNMKRLGKVYP
jgi:hypothetical protein